MWNSFFHCRWRRQKRIWRVPAYHTWIPRGEGQVVTLRTERSRSGQVRSWPLRNRMSSDCDLEQRKVMNFERIWPGLFNCRRRARNSHVPVELWRVLWILNDTIWIKTWPWTWHKVATSVEPWWLQHWWRKARALKEGEKFIFCPESENIQNSVEHCRNVCIWLADSVIWEVMWSKRLPTMFLKLRNILMLTNYGMFFYCNNSFKVVC